MLITCKRGQTRTNLVASIPVRGECGLCKGGGEGKTPLRCPCSLCTGTLAMQVNLGLFEPLVMYVSKSTLTAS